jgi:hypothetical protein
MRGGEPVVGAVSQRVNKMEKVAIKAISPSLKASSRGNNLIRIHSHVL